MKKILAYFVSCLVLNACAYRFSNLHMRPPVIGMKSIGIEAVFDSGQVVVPHEHLWSGLQEAFASNGILRVTSIDTADAYLKVHLKDTFIVPGEPQQLGEEEDPKFPNHEIVERGANQVPTGRLLYEPRVPSEYSRLSRALYYSDHEQIGFVIDVELWDTRTASKVLSKSYPVSGRYPVLDTTTVVEDRSLRALESREFQIQNMLKPVVLHIVQDVLRG
ncbi:MAG: hypothetical protein AB8C84_00825 [Oligoflexales bacterium]